MLNVDLNSPIIWRSWILNRPVFCVCVCPDYWKSFRFCLCPGMSQHDFLTNLPAPVKIWAHDSFSHLFSENSLERMIIKIDKRIAEKSGSHTITAISPQLLQHAAGIMKWYHNDLQCNECQFLLENKRKQQQSSSVVWPRALHLSKASRFEHASDHMIASAIINARHEQRVTQGMKRSDLMKAIEE